MMFLLVDFAIRSALLVLAAGVILRLARIRTARGRHAVWTTVLIGMLTLPLWSAWGPRVEVPVPVRVQLATGPQRPAASPPMDAAQVLLAPTESPAAVSTLPRTPSRQIRLDYVALTIYVLGALILLGRLALGTDRVRRLLREAVPGEGHLTSATCITPITVGWLRPVIVLPRDHSAWPFSQLDAVLAHEREHVRRRDPLVLWLALLNRALFWFNPIAWWLERHLTSLAEEACDSAVIARGHSADDYAGYLIATARTVAQGGGRIQPVGNAFPGTSLTARVDRILNDPPRTPEPRMRAAFALVLSISSCALIAAGTAISPLQGALLSEFWLDDDEWHREVAPLMTPEESSAYRRLKTSGERDAFIADFWRRRDGTPATPENEVRRDFEQRVAYAREHLTNNESFALPGYETDRGRFYVAWGAPEAVSTSGPGEEWRYRFVSAFGSAVTLNFDPSADFGCSVRGGLYRITSPAPSARFEGSAGSAGPVAATYPGGFVHLTFPIDANATKVRFTMQARSGVETTWGEIRGPIDYVQGEISGVPQRGGGMEPILAHLAKAGQVRFFERNSYGCTEQLPPDTYTLSVETTLSNGTRRTDAVTFAVASAPLVQAAVQATERPRFDVASVKQNKSTNQFITAQVEPGGRFVAQNFSLKLLVAMAYKVRDFQIVGGPSWMDTDRFDITAKAERELPPMQADGQIGPLELMLQSLLAERFGLVARPETQDRPMYALVFARADRRLGEKLQRSTVDCAAMLAERSRSGEPIRGPLMGKERPVCGMAITPWSMRVGGVPLSQFASVLSQMTSRFVEDRTGLSGAYDIDLECTPPGARAGGPGGDASPIPAPPLNPNGPTLETAVQEQLGLKLEATRGPVPMVVVDRAEAPTPD